MHYKNACMFRTFAMGEAHRQFWRRVRICHQRGHAVHIQDQPGCPTLSPHQHRLCFSGSKQLERARPSTWQGCHWWAFAAPVTVSTEGSGLSSSSSRNPDCNLPVSPSAVFATCTYSSFLFVCFLHDVKNVLKMYRLSTGEELRTFPLDVGSVVGFTGRKRDSEIFYYFTSFLSPGISCLCQIPLENVFKILLFVRNI